MMQIQQDTSQQPVFALTGVAAQSGRRRDGGPHVHQVAMLPIGDFAAPSYCCRSCTLFGPRCMQLRGGSGAPAPEWYVREPAVRLNARPPSLGCASTRLTTMAR